MLNLEDFLIHQRIKKYTYAYRVLGGISHSVHSYHQSNQRRQLKKNFKKKSLHFLSVVIKNQNILKNLNLRLSFIPGMTACRYPQCMPWFQGSLCLHNMWMGCEHIPQPGFLKKYKIIKKTLYNSVQVFWLLFLPVKSGGQEQTLL